jgi:DNA-binding NarL/FixJ family response regulator
MAIAVSRKTPAVSGNIRMGGRRSLCVECTIAYREAQGMADDDHHRGALIALADDHPIVRSALKSALGTLGPFTRFLEAADAASARELARTRLDVDLMLMDLGMPGSQGTATVRAIRSEVPQLPLAVVSAQEDPAIVADLLSLGVCGFIPKSDTANVIVGAVRLMLDGGTYVPTRLVQRVQPAAVSRDDAPARLDLTSRQWDVLRLLAEGKSNKVIARELGITEGTVKVHLLAVFRALDVRNRTAAVVAAGERYRSASSPPH